MKKLFLCIMAVAAMLLIPALKMKAQVHNFGTISLNGQDSFSMPRMTRLQTPYLPWISMSRRLMHIALYQHMLHHVGQYLDMRNQYTAISKETRSERDFIWSISKFQHRSKANACCYISAGCGIQLKYGSTDSGSAVMTADIHHLQWMHQRRWKPVKTTCWPFVCVRCTMAIRQIPMMTWDSVQFSVSIYYFPI